MDARNNPDFASLARAVWPALDTQTPPPPALARYAMALPLPNGGASRDALLWVAGDAQYGLDRAVAVAGLYGADVPPFRRAADFWQWLAGTQLAILAAGAPATGLIPAVEPVCGITGFIRYRRLSGGTEYRLWRLQDINLPADAAQAADWDSPVSLAAANAALLAAFRFHEGRLYVGDRV